jgi:hypothetical protein
MWDRRTAFIAVEARELNQRMANDEVIEHESGAE